MVCDIDRGGAFAHLFGTWSLMAPDERARIEGFVLNKFRGDPALLSPAPEMLRERTGVPVVGVVPVAASRAARRGRRRDRRRARAPDDGRPVVGIVYYPAASNLDELKMLEQVARVRWIPAAGRSGRRRAGRASRQQARDRRPRLAARDRPRCRDRRACRGGPARPGDLRRSADAGTGAARCRRRARPTPTASACCRCARRFGAEKLTARTEVRFSAEPCRPVGAAERCRPGRLRDPSGRTEATAAIDEALAGGCGWARGAVLGITVHGVSGAAGDPATTC